MKLISMSDNLSGALNTAPHFRKSQRSVTKIVSRPYRRFYDTWSDTFATNQPSAEGARRVESHASSCGV